MKNGFGVSFRALTEVTAIAITEDTLFLAIATQQADRSNGRLHSLEAVAQVVLKLGVRKLALGLVWQHRKRLGRHGVQLGTKYCLRQQPIQGLKQLLETLHVIKTGYEALELFAALLMIAQRPSMLGFILVWESLTGIISVRLLRSCGARAFTSNQGG
jgi:hypothetical protein